MSSVNILFYSNFCDGSKLLISMMQTEKIIQYFHLFCTDNNSQTPQQIKVTPTIMIRGVPTPYVAGDAFSWLARIKQWKMRMMLQKMNNAQQQYFKSINSNLLDDKTNILEFSPAEMNGMSDIFSFFSQNIAQECQEALPQTFFTCDNLGKDNIFTPPLEDGSYKVVKDSKCKINISKQKELQTKLELQRKQQDESTKQIIDNFVSQYKKN